MTSEEVQVQCKLTERDGINTEIQDLIDILEIKRKAVKEINTWLHNNCKHEWEYCRDSSWDTPDYQCKICNCFQSENGCRN